MLNSVRQIIRKIVPLSLRPFVRRLVPVPMRSSLPYETWKRTDPSNWPLHELIEKQGIEKYEYSLFSQNGEDGILRYLFSEIGFRSKLFLEFGFGVTENNSLRLILKEAFGGVFIDGSELPVIELNLALNALGITNVRAINTFITLENIKTILSKSGLPEDIDLLSIDVDGNDYWFWEGIKCLSPRIVVIEYNASLGPQLSLTVPYDSLFDRHQKHPSGFYCGASIAALERLGKKKGYCLIGCDSSGINAFFIREDCLTHNLVPLSPQLAYRTHKNRLDRGFSLEDQFRIIENLPYVDVE